MIRTMKVLWLTAIQLLGCFVGLVIGGLSWVLLHYLVGDAAYLTIVVMTIFAPFAIVYSLENTH